jgi:hypothetical protein
MTVDSAQFELTAAASGYLDVIHASQNEMLVPSSNRQNDMNASFPKSNTESSATREIEKTRFNKALGSDEGAAVPCCPELANGRTNVSAMAEMSTA